LRFPKTKFKLNVSKLGSLKDSTLKEVRVKPHHNIFTIELILDVIKTVIELKEISTNIIGIDLGINNFATITNNAGKQPFVINGKSINSMNQYYNKQKAYLTAVLRNKLQKIVMEVQI
jgi:putative transposase